MTWLDNNQWLAWLGLALILGAIETATVDFVFIMFAGGALAASIAAGLGASFPVQVIVAVVASAILLVLVRPITKRHFNTEPSGDGIGAARLVGQHAQVLEPVTDHDGRVKLAGETWTARAAAPNTRIEPGARVMVTSIDGATAIVAPSYE